MYMPRIYFPCHGIPPVVEKTKNKNNLCTVHRVQLLSFTGCLGDSCLRYTAGESMER